MRNVAKYSNADSNTAEEKIRVLLLVGAPESGNPLDDGSGDDLVTGDSALFCATGISDSALLPGVKVTGKKGDHSLNHYAQSESNREIHPRRA